MLKGYRSLGIAALVASLAIAFGIGAYVTALSYPEKQEGYQSYQSGQTIENGPSTTIADISVRKVENTPCQNPKSETESDLCAQWRSAKANEKSADWTLYGVIASLLGISFLLWQIMLTREAVQDTGKATIAMTKSNKIAENAQRPWISLNFVPKQISWEANTIYFEIDVVTENVGQSPAFDYSLSIEMFFGKDGLILDLENWFDDESINQKPSRKVLIPKSPEVFPYWRHQAKRSVVWQGDEGDKEFSIIIAATAHFKIKKTDKRWQRVERAIYIARRKEGRIDLFFPENHASLNETDLMAFPFTSSAFAHFNLEDDAEDQK